MDAWAGIKPQDIPAAWPAIDDLIEAACKRSNGRLTAQMVYTDLLSGEMQLWVTHNDGEISACFVTQIINYPEAKCCRIVIGTGKGWKRWIHRVEILEAWGKQNGCTGIEAIARKGWARLFTRFLTGWKITHVFIEKRI